MSSWADDTPIMFFVLPSHIISTVGCGPLPLQSRYLSIWLSHVRRIVDSKYIASDLASANDRRSAQDAARRCEATEGHRYPCREVGGGAASGTQSLAARRNLSDSTDGPDHLSPVSISVSGTEECGT